MGRSKARIIKSVKLIFMKLTYKEQAEELIQDFYTNKLDQYDTFGKYNYSFAVDCAILTVTKIISSLRKTIPEIGLGKGY